MTEAATAGEGTLNLELEDARSHIATLEQLLAVHEQTALEQATRLESALAREQAANALASENERRLRLALDAGKMGTWEWDIVNNSVYWSPEEERLYGLEEGEYDGTIEMYAGLMHPDDRDPALQAAMSALESRARSHHVMHRIVRKDGEIRWLDSHARFIYSSDGQPLRLVGVSIDATERLEMEAARDRAHAEATAERQRLFDVFMQAPAAIAVLEGPTHVFKVANPFYAQLIGNRSVVGQAVAEALPEVVEQGFLTLLDQVFESGEPFSATEMRVLIDRDNDGVAEELFVDFVYQPLKNFEGRTFGIMVHAVEVTEQVLARRRVESLAAERSAILGQIADVVITADPQGNITFANDAAVNLYGGVEIGEPIWSEKQPFELLDLSGARRKAEAVPLYRAVRSERVLNDEWRVRREDGTELTIVGSAVPVTDSAGKSLGAVMTARDVSEQRKLQRALEHERGRLRDVLMQTPAAISVTEGPEHVIVMQNAFAMQLIGGRNLVGRKAHDVFPEIVEQGIVAIQDEVFRSGEPFIGRELPVTFDRLGDGVMTQGYFNIVYHPLRNAENEVYGLLSFAVEVTDLVQSRKQVEEKARELAVLTEELERSNHDLDQFAYVASHDLKAPLRGIANLSQWIEEDLDDRLGAESREHMQLLRGRVHRMEALIEGVLHYSRAGRRREKTEVVDVGSLVEETISLIDPPETARVTVKGAMPQLLTERVPLQQVFLNLINNAIKHGNAGGAVVEVGSERTSDGWRFSVSDNGPGIAPQFHDRIWQIFQTLAPRDSVEGTGIGLSVVRKIVETRGGRAWVESSEGQGATFYFTWPETQEIS
jgi:PAS domain S-box-containing protein